MKNVLAIFTLVAVFSVAFSVQAQEEKVVVSDTTWLLNQPGTTYVLENDHAGTACPAHIYTFMVMANNITIDGANYAITGYGAAEEPCVVIHANSAVLRNCRINAFSSAVVIYADSCLVEGNSITNCPYLKVFGNGNRVVNNTIDGECEIIDGGIGNIINNTLAGVERGGEANMSFALNQNFPNPFNPETTIAYVVGESGPVKLTIYDMLGRKVAMLVDGWQSTGFHQTIFNARDLAGGVYFYCLETPGFIQMKKMVLQK